MGDSNRCRVQVRNPGCGDDDAVACFPHSSPAPCIGSTLAPPFCGRPPPSPLSTFLIMVDRTPPLGIPTNDPEQLPLGVFEGVPMLPVGEKAGEEGESGETAIAVREPPVCGEWSFDLSDDAEARGG